MHGAGAEIRKHVDCLTPHVHVAAAALQALKALPACTLASGVELQCKQMTTALTVIE